MNQLSETYKELNSISPVLARQAKVNPFSVPDNYFEKNAAVLFDVATSFMHPSKELFNAIRDTPTMKIPEGYFEQLPDSILKRIQQTEAETGNQELTAISPLIASIPKTNVFTTSSTYFDEALKAITTKTIHKQTTRVFPLNQRLTWSHLAAAATLVFMIMFGAFYVLKQSNPSNDSVINAAMQIKTEKQFETLLAQINETDLINYLQISSDNKDVETILSMVDSDQLPEESEYLNAEFSDKFLNYIDTNN